MYGGFEIEYIFYPMDLFHISVYTLLGMGNISNKNDYYQSDGDYHMGEMNSFFVAEPAINLEVNVTTFFHFAIGASYRHTIGAEYQTITDSDISGLNGALIFKFGKF